MKIIATGQPPGGLPNKPVLVQPVQIVLDVPVYYRGSGHLQPMAAPITCDRAHAELIYAPLNAWAVKYHFAVVHLGTYYARPARHPNGTDILLHGKPRWSGHAYGAIDWTGVIASNGQFYDTNALAAQAPAKLSELLTDLERAIKAAKRTAEIVHEPHWYHLGLVPAGGW